MKPILLAALLFVLAACSRSSAAESTKALKTIQSWIATAQMTGEAWQEGSVPDVYAKQTLEKSQQEISKEAQGLTISSELSQQLQKTQQILEEITADIEHHNKTATVIALQKLSNEQKQLNTAAAAQGIQL